MSIVALALNKWEIKNHSNTALNQERGLWKMCGRGRCVDLPMASRKYTCLVLLFNAF